MARLVQTLMGILSASGGLVAGLVVALVVGLGSALALAAPPAPLTARLVSAVVGVGAGTTVPLGLAVTLAPGWKTYWRSPGDAGLPPSLSWTGSSNLRQVELAYPAPQRFSQFGLETAGYEGEVVFPLTATVEQPGQPLALKLAAELLVCQEICVPAHSELTLTIPAGPALPSAEAGEIGRWVARVPGDGREAGLTIEKAEVGTAPGSGPGSGSSGAVTVLVTARAEPPLSQPDAFLETEPPLAFGQPELGLSEGGRRLQLRFSAAAGTAAAAGEGGRSLVGQPLTVTLVEAGTGGHRSAERRLTLEPLPAGAEGGPLAGAGPVGLSAAVLGAALLGGLILNLMPCVLPVLSLKLFQLVRLGGAAPGRVRAGFLATAAGIVSSFLLLAAVLIGLKAAGAAVGWGIQFQQPLFLALLVLLLTLFAANLWGWLEFLLPAPLADWAGRVGQDGPSERPPSLGGAFLTGAFATVMATPCSAPFVGTAVGAALSRGPLEILAVFGLLGLGLALPYLAVAAVPQVARLLPRPGRWMIGLRVVLGLLLAGTVAWLLTVLAAQLAPAALPVLVGLVLGLAALLGLRHWLGERAGGLPRALASGTAAAVALMILIVPALNALPPATAAVTGAERAWVPFERAAIERAVAEGKTVLVEVTAAWCLTCQVNERLVLTRGEVAERLFGVANVIPMRADWTRPDPAITAFLAAFGRYGVPLTVIYGPGKPEGLLLPELLQVGDVLEGLRVAGGK